MSHANPPSKTPLTVVGIGGADGCFGDLASLLAAVGSNDQLAHIVVQSLCGPALEQACQTLEKAIPQRVIVATEGMHLEPGAVYVTSGDCVVEFRDNKLHCTKEPEGPRPQLPIDRFLESLAKEFESRAVAIVLAGTGSDGALGIQHVKAAGGVVFVQEDRSSKRSSLGYAARVTGNADFSLSPEEIARELQTVVRHPYLAAAIASTDVPRLEENSADLDKLLRLLRIGMGVDFTNYKQSTIRRRIARRMMLHRIQKLDAYLRLLKETPNELDLLYNDLLIRVTSFFRDPEMFQALRENIFPQLVKNRSPEEGIRIWVPGCASGEEVYSLAISILEFLKESEIECPVQFFGTDISEVALDRARTGIYIDSALADMPEERIRRFFAKIDGHYQISKSVRDICIFAKQNITSDPPFSRLDLISCRNVLIYLDHVLQKKVLPIFHYALRPSGYLVLGNSETIVSFSDYFAPADRTQKIYEKKQTSGRLPLDFSSSASALRTRPPSTAPYGEEAVRSHDPQREADRLALARYVPPGVLVDSSFDIIQYRGETGPFLKPAPGAPSHNLLRMAREGMLAGLREVVQRAKAENEPVRSVPLQIKDEEKSLAVELYVSPVRVPQADKVYFLILFEVLQNPSSRKEKKRSRKTSTSASEANTEHLRQELEATKSYLQAIIEEQEATNEALKAANEEILSSNEELQSTNEELQTAKEEIQSSNEELSTVNEELENRNRELSSLNNDFRNLLGGVNVPVVMLEQDFRIRRFTAPAERLLKLIPHDLGRSIHDVRLGVSIPHLERTLKTVSETLTPVEDRVLDTRGAWHVVRTLPFRTEDNRIDGVLMVFQEFDPFNVAAAIVGHLSRPFLVLNEEFRVLSASAAFLKLYEPPRDIVGMTLSELNQRNWNLAALQPKLQSHLATKASAAEEISLTVGSLGERKLRVVGQQIAAGAAGDEVRPSTAIITVEDVTSAG